MMRSRSWVQLTRTYGYDRKGAARARDRRVAQREIDSCWDEIEDDRRIRECWNFHYSLYWDRPDIADRVLDLYGIPRPPSRARHTS